LHQLAIFVNDYFMARAGSPHVLFLNAKIKQLWPLAIEFKPISDFTSI
jgi:hypothetical protein